MRWQREAGRVNRRVWRLARDGWRPSTHSDMGQKRVRDGFVRPCASLRQGKDEVVFVRTGPVGFAKSLELCRKGQDTLLIESAVRSTDNRTRAVGSAGIVDRSDHVTRGLATRRQCSFQRLLKTLRKCRCPNYPSPSRRLEPRQIPGSTE